MKRSANGSATTAGPSSLLEKPGNTGFQPVCVSGILPESKDNYRLVRSREANPVAHSAKIAELHISKDC